MFKQTKSMIVWFYLIKYRKKISFCISLLILAFFSNLIYVDIVQYLQISNQTHLLTYILPLKWLFIIFCIYISTLQILSIFKNKRIDNNSNKEILISKKNIKKVEKNENKFSKKEEEFLHKKKLNAKACFLIKRQKER